jgi:hypothetical protein
MGLKVLGGRSDVGSEPYTLKVLRYQFKANYKGIILIILILILISIELLSL